MRVAVIINPASGRRDARLGAVERTAIARRMIPDAQIDITRAAGHAAELSRAHLEAGADLVLAWGGDGTVNEVAGPLIGRPAALGIIPSGSGDGLARGLGLPLRPVEAIERVLSGRRRVIDTGRLGARHFLNIAGVGFDATVAAAFNRSARRGVGVYVMGALRSVWTYQPPPCRIGTGDVMHEGRLFVAAFANGPQYGNGLVIAPDADPSDGWLNLVLVDEGAPLRQLWRARRLVVAPLTPAAGVHRLQVESAWVEGDRLACHVDGETFESTGRLDVGVRKSSLVVAGAAE